MKDYSIELKSKRKANLIRLFLWTFGWLLTEALTVFGHKYLWQQTAGITVTCLIINLAFGLGMIYANRKLLLDGDDLERKIQLESMGLTLGLTLIAGITYTLLDATNLIRTHANINQLIIFMAITYIISLVINRNKYR